MGILEQILASVDNAKRAAGRNVKDLITNPTDFLSMVTGRIAEQNKKIANADSESLSELAGNMIPGGGIAGTLVGAEAKYSSQQILKAMQRLAKGDDAGKVFQETGIYKGPVDQLPRAHISDKQARIKTENLTPNQYDKELLGVPLSSDLKLSDLLDHPELFAAVPELANVKIKPNLALGSLGAYDRGANTIHFSAMKQGRDDAEALSTLLHETQHAIQNQFGFTPGGNTGMFVADPKLLRDAKFGAYTLQSQKQAEKEALKKAGKDTGDVDNFLSQIQKTIEGFNKVESDALDSYLKIGGEAEARAVQAQHKNEVFNSVFQGPQQRFLFNRVTPYKDSGYPLDFYDLPIQDLIASPIK